MNKIKLKLALFKCSLQVHLYSLKLKWKRLTGYIDKNGVPTKCPYCKCKQMETYETFRHDQGFLEEYWVRCSKCKQQTGVWAYGSWYYK